MNLMFVVIVIHFSLGALGILFANRKLPADRKTHNWIKYFFYLIIFLIILSSVLINKKVFAGLTIIILSLSLFELLKLSKLPFNLISREKFLFISVSIFSLMALFFSIFVLLPSGIIIYTYIIVIVFDGASQISGQLAGRTKLLPVLSPGKTLEGLAGGTVSAVLTSVILHDLGGFPLLKALAFGLVVCLASFLGDMSASAFKRAFGAKDFGTFLPGQGGMLDRFDSFITAGAIIGMIGILSGFSLRNADSDLAAYLGCSLLLAIILLTGEVIRYIFSAKPEYSRIFSHILAGGVSLFIIDLFTSFWYIISICIQSAIFLLVSKKMGVFGSHHSIERKTEGSSLFFIGVLAAYFISYLKGDASLYFLSIIILMISDPVAAIAGMRYKSESWPSYSAVSAKSKTPLGSTAFFVSTFIILITGLTFYRSFSFPLLLTVSLIISILVTFAEAVSPYGTDNLTIPVTSALCLSLITG